jgi:tetratricopeptide (TPR) repeat protein
MRCRPLAALRAAALLLCLGVPLAAQEESPAQAAFARGRAEFRLRNHDGAAKWFEKAVQLESANAEYHLWLGHAYTRQLVKVNFIRQGMLARRVSAAYNKAVELAPTSVEAAQSRFEFFMEAPAIAGGGMDKARVEAERIVTLNRYRGMMARGQLESKAERYDRAEEAYRALTAEFPDSSGAFVGLATFYQTRGRYGDAFAVIDSRLTSVPDDTSVVYQLGRAAAVSGQQLDRGERALRKFLAMLGVRDTLNQAHAHYRLGMIGEHRGDVATARAEYQRAIELYPQHEPASAALKKLK